MGCTSYKVISGEGVFYVFYNDSLLNTFWDDHQNDFIKFWYFNESRCFVLGTKLGMEGFGADLLFEYFGGVVGFNRSMD